MSRSYSRRPPGKMVSPALKGTVSRISNSGFSLFGFLSALYHRLFVILICS
jgi:hypothetical protein